MRPVALNDSPAGLLAWVVEKLVERADVPLDDISAFEALSSRDRVLTEAMISWVPQSIQSSFRASYEGADTPAPVLPVEVPAAVVIQRHEADYPEQLARDFCRDLRVFERLSEGGHFTAAEVPLSSRTGSEHSHWSWVCSRPEREGGGGVCRVRLCP